MSFDMTDKPEILLTEISIVLRTDQLLSKRAFPEYANTISPFCLPAPVQGQICNYKHQVLKCLNLVNGEWCNGYCARFVF